jgi:UDP-MurNAc hydroxylase
MPFELEFVNHAGLVLRDPGGGPVLVADPWLTGSAFDNGWDLLAPTDFPPERWADVTHLWFSHEHPDHFSPPSLRAVPEERRAEITVLYQPTRDRRVVDWCRSAGFATRELPVGTWVPLGPELRVLLGTVPFYDSWLALDCAGHRLLNLNDCVVNTREQLQRIAHQVGPVDTLLTQFSYANWVGNPDDAEAREAAAAEKLSWLRLQTEVLRPARVVPFASFSWFSHEENAYLNDARVTVGRAVEEIEAAGAGPLVLFPGDRWELGTPHESLDAVRRWEKLGPDDEALRTSAAVPLDELQKLSDAYAARLAKKNNRVLLAAAAAVGFLRPLTIRLWDLDTTVEFDVRHGLRLTATKPAQVAMASESLAFVLRHEWGMDTLSVNGRFRALVPDGYTRLLRCFSVSVLNNTGRTFGFRLLADPALARRGIEKFIRP